MLPKDRAILRNLLVVMLTSTGGALVLGTTCLGRDLAQPGPTAMMPGDRGSVRSSAGGVPNGPAGRTTITSGQLERGGSANGVPGQGAVPAPQPYPPQVRGEPQGPAGAPFPGGQPPYNVPPSFGPGGMPPNGAMPPGAMPPGAMPNGAMPPGAMPPQGAMPNGAMPPGAMPPQGAMPPGAMPPQGAMPPGAMPPQGAMPPGARPAAPNGAPPPNGAAAADAGSPAPAFRTPTQGLEAGAGQFMTEPAPFSASSLAPNPEAGAGPFTTEPPR
ncbi:MAG: hypothetical protein KF782_32475 [Labilithrix sp.]|nr:hypothetical protein [Labilithrix sp.]